VLSEAGFIVLMQLSIDRSDTRKSLGGESRALIEGFHEIQDGLNYGFIAYGGIYHDLIYRPTRPFDVKILLNKIHAIVIDGVNQCVCFLLSLTARHKAPHLVLPWGIEKHAKCVRLALKKML